MSVYRIANSIYKYLDNFGIGTTAPTHKLHIYSTSNNDNDYESAGILLDNATQGEAAIAFRNSNVAVGGNVWFMGLNSNSTRFDIGYGAQTSQLADASVDMCIDTGGNVGIGTTNPQYKLDIKGGLQVGKQQDGDVLINFNTDRPWTLLQSGTGANTDLHLKSSSSGKYFYIRDTFDNTFAGFYSHGSGGIQSRLWAQQAVIGETYRYTNPPANTLLISGNLGIGTATPLYKLHVEGTSYLNGTVTTNNNNIDAGSGTITASSLAGGVITNSTSTTSSTVAASATAVKSAYDLASAALPKTGGTVTGDVVISANLTASNLTVIGDTTVLNTVSSNTEQMVITNAGTGPALKVTQSGNNSVAEFYDNESGIALFVGNNGNVGIGTTNPVYKLQVEGTTYLNGTITTNNNNINVGTGIVTAATFSGTATRVSQEHVPGTYLTGTNYNGVGTVTWAVDATSANTASKVVVRDASGNFSAGTITASLIGTASQVSQNLTRGAYLIGANYNGSVATTWDIDATSANTVSKIVVRDASGNFSAGTITASLTGTATRVSQEHVPGTYLTGTNYNGVGTVTWAVDATTTATASKVVTRDASAYLFANGVGIGTATARQLLDIQGGNAIISGNVGIGTTNPLVTLAIGSGSADVTSTLMFNSADTATNTDKLYWTYIKNGSRIGHNTGWNVNHYAGQSNTAVAPSNGNFHFFTGGPEYNERFTILNNGNVGVGSTQPAYRLDVAGNALINGTITTNNNNINTGSGTITAGSLAGGMITNSTSTTSSSIAASATAVKSAYDLASAALPKTGGTVTGNVTILANLTANNLTVIGDTTVLNTVSSNTEQMVITNAGTGPALKVTQSGNNSVAEFYDNESGIALFVGNNGNVGIGTTNPQYAVDVIGDVNFTGILRQGGAAYVSSQFTSNNANNTLYYNGSIGIGTANSLSYKLNVNGNVNINNLQGNATDLYIIKSNGGPSSLKIEGTEPLYFPNPLPSYIELYRPSDSYGSGTYIKDRTTNKSWFHGYPYQLNPDDSFAPPIPSDSYQIGYVNSASLDPADTSNSIFTIKNNGNVGIGTTDPSKKLDVNGDINFNGSLYQNNSLYISSQWTSNNATNSLYYNGNVGIGTTNPSKKLDVSGDINFTGSLYQNGTLFSGGGGNTLNINQINYIDPLRKVFYVQETSQNEFILTTEGLYGGYASNVQIFVGQNLLSYYNSNINDYNLSISYTSSTTIYTVTLTESVDYASIVDITIWPTVLTSSQLNVSTNYQLSPIRSINYVNPGPTSTFTLSTDGYFGGSACNVELFVDNNKLTYYSDTINDYQLAVSYDFINTKTNYTVTLTNPAVFGNLVDITVWPQMLSESIPNPLKLYQYININYTTPINAPLQVTPIRKVFYVESASESVFEIITLGVYGGTASNIQVFVGQSLLTYYNSSIADYTLDISYGYGGDSTLYTITLTNPVEYASLVDITIWPTIISGLNMVGSIYQNVTTTSQWTSGNSSDIYYYTSGNVGIGTTNPVAKLHVVGNVLATGTITASNISVIGDFVTMNTVTSNTEQMVITNAGTGPALKVTQTGDNSVAEFYDNESGIALFVGNNGNVGIGTTDPQTIFHVRPNTSSTGVIIDQVGTGSILDIKDGGVSKVIVDTNGNVGVGTTDPQTTLHVRPNTSTTGVIIDQVGTGSILDVRDGGVSKVIVDTNGNVGIGTTDPLAYLHIGAGTATVAPIRLTSGTNLTSAVAGTIEYDGGHFYGTTAATNAPAERGYIPSIQTFRLSANGSAIGPTINNFFGANSGVILGANALYEFEAYCYFTKTTAGTVTVTLSFSSSYNNPQNLNAILQYGAAAGGTATGAANQIAIFAAGSAGGGAGANINFGASASLTTAVNHAFQIRSIINTANGYAQLTLKFTSSAGTVTPLRGSYYKVTRIPTTNTGSFV